MTTATKRAKKKAKRSKLPPPAFFLPHGASRNQRLRLKRGAASYPLLVGTNEENKVLNKLQNAATHRVANYSTRSSRMFQYGQKDVGYDLADMALRAAIQGSRYRRTLRKRNKRLMPYQVLAAPPPYTPVPSTSSYITPRPSFESAVSRIIPMHPMHPPKPPSAVKERTFAELCYGASCGLFGTRPPSGGRRTIRKRRQTRSK
jgi:hypothetical protein